MQTLLTYWKAVSDAGCHSGLRPPEKKRIRLANQSSLILFALILLYVPVFFFFKQNMIGWTTAAVALLFLLVPFLQKIKKGSLSVRYYFMSLSYASVFLYSILLGRDAGIHIFLVSAIATPFVVLEIHQLRSAVLFALMPIGLIGFLELYAFPNIEPIAMSAAARHFIYLMVLPSAALTTFLFSGYFYIINQMSERTLNKTIEDLHASNRMIAEQQLQLASASRLSAIGELSGSIAHEINNPLAIILGYTEQIIRLLQFETLDKERINGVCDKILKTINRITKIILGLRKLAREGGDDPLELANLCDVVDDSISVCTESLYHAGIELRIKVPPHPCLALCRPLQISQVLLNLIQNAKDAVSTLDERWLEIEVLQLDDFHQVIVRDSGRITDIETLQKIGQPFFTTKPPGKGTGLGLSISKKIVLAHGGTIEIDREASRTTFVLQLPRRVQSY